MTPGNDMIKGTKCGILGAGQLSLMLIEGARRLGIEPLVYAASPREPAARVAQRLITGPMAADAAPLRLFLSQCDVVVFENEFVPSAALREAAKGLSCRFLPDLAVMERVRSKLEQKRALHELAIPAAPWEKAPEDTGAVKDWLSSLPRRFPGGAVLKWAEYGYDGLGTHFFDPGRLEEAALFCGRALGRGVAVYAEGRVDFRRELAVVACRSVAGAFATYPLVISEQRGGVCHRVRGPAIGLGVAEARQEQAIAQAKALGDSLGLVGCYALEFFETADGLFVNEVAPRVHNTGHYSQDACAVSQFENHWRAVLGLPLGSTAAASGFFSMLNLLGSAGASGPAGNGPQPPASLEAALHWYGKDEVRPGRKMGHVNFVAPSPEALDGLEERWHLSMRGNHGQ